MKNALTYILIAVILLAIVGIASFFIYRTGQLKSKLHNERQNTAHYQELADMNKREMENDFQQYVMEYHEFQQGIRQELAKDTIHDNSKNLELLKRAEQSEQKTKALLAELKQTKSTNAAEISRLKQELSRVQKELNTMREVLRSYIGQVDSLHRENQSLRTQNQTVRSQVDEANSRIATLNKEKADAQKKVAIAAQLDANSLSLGALDKKGKAAKKTKDISSFVASFHISRNVTAHTGQRRIFVRILKPTNEVLQQSGTCTYENTSVGYTLSKTVEYTGEETPVTLYVNINEMTTAGTYRMQVIADGHSLGSTSFSIEK